MMLDQAEFIRTLSNCQNDGPSLSQIGASSSCANPPYAYIFRKLHQKDYIFIRCIGVGEVAPFSRSPIKMLPLLLLGLLNQGASAVRRSSFPGLQIEKGYCLENRQSSHSLSLSFSRHKGSLCVIIHQHAKGLYYLARIKVPLQQVLGITKKVREIYACFQVNTPSHYTDAVQSKGHLSGSNPETRMTGAYTYSFSPKGVTLLLHSLTISSSTDRNGVLTEYPSRSVPSLFCSSSTPQSRRLYLHHSLSMPVPTTPQASMSSKGGVSRMHHTERLWRQCLLECDLQSFSRCRIFKGWISIQVPSKYNWTHCAKNLPCRHQFVREIFNIPNSKVPCSLTISNLTCLRKTLSATKDNTTCPLLLSLSIEQTTSCQHGDFRICHAINPTNFPAQYAIIPHIQKGGDISNWLRACSQKDYRRINLHKRLCWDEPRGVHSSLARRLCSREAAGGIENRVKGALRVADGVAVRSV